MNLYLKQNSKRVNYKNKSFVLSIRILCFKNYIIYVLVSDILFELLEGFFPIKASETLEGLLCLFLYCFSKPVLKSWNHIATGLILDGQAGIKI